MIEFTKRKLPKGTVVYRGLSQKRADDLKGLKKGQVVQFKGMLSTTLKPGTATQFATSGTGGNLTTVMELDAKTGASMMDFSTHTEYEVLQAHDVEYKFVKYEEAVEVDGRRINIVRMAEVTR